MLLQETDEEAFAENRQLLQTFTLYLVKANSPIDEAVPHAILQSLLPLAETLISTTTGETSGFSEIMVVMHTLAASGNGSGHLILFQAATSWLKLWYALTLYQY
jgi:E3 ubiquitin-protein ligase UBR4